MKLFRFLSWTAPKIALSHVNRLGRGTLADGVNGIVPLGGLKGVGARPRTTHPLAKRLTGPENRGGGGECKKANPKHKDQAENCQPPDQLCFQVDIQTPSRSTGQESSSQCPVKI